MTTEQMSAEMMKCHRCEGLLVRDSIFNLDGQFHHLEVLRCLNCGETVDATILKAREVCKMTREEERNSSFTQGTSIKENVRRERVGAQV